MLFHTITNFIANAIFNGAATITICIVITNLFKLKLYKINISILVRAINITMLIMATVFIVTLSAEIFVAYFSGGENMQYTFANRLFGPYWWAAFALLIRSTLLPQIFWFRKLRRSFTATIVVVAVWIIVNIVITVAELKAGMSFDWPKQLEQMLFYGVFLTAIYFILDRKTISAHLT